MKATTRQRQIDIALANLREELTETDRRIRMSHSEMEADGHRLVKRELLKQQAKLYKEKQAHDQANL